MVRSLELNETWQESRTNFFFSFLSSMASNRHQDEAPTLKSGYGHLGTMFLRYEYRGQTDICIGIFLTIPLCHMFYID